MRNTFSLVQNLGACLLFGSAVFSATMNTAEAQKPHQGLTFKEFRVGVGLSGERWAEDAIATVYGKMGNCFRHSR